jgi:acetyl-CoA acetyltransferase
LDGVVIVGTYNTEQARRLDGHDSVSIALAAARGVLERTGTETAAIDAVFGSVSGDLIRALGLGAVVDGRCPGGISTVLHAAAAVRSGLCTTALVVDGGADLYTDRAATAPWTRPMNEFVAPFGLFTAVEFALMARRHMELHGTTPEHLATAAATIRNHGHRNPEAVYFERGPYSPEDVLASRMIADPFHLLDCSMTSEGGTAILLTTPDRVENTSLLPVHLLGAGLDSFGPAYRHAPVWDLASRSGAIAGEVGTGAAKRAFAMAGLSPGDVDVCELYDPFSFEVIRQLEAFGFCPPGEGGPFVADGHIAHGASLPVTTDGGTLSFSHAGGSVQMLQRVVRGVEQLQGRCGELQVEGAEVALCSNGGAGAMFNHVLLLGVEAA